MEPMKWCWPLLLVWILTVLPAAAQKAEAPSPELDRVVRALPLSKRSAAHMLLARAGGAGRKIMLDALSDAGKVPQKGTAAKEWPEKDLLARLKTAMEANKFKRLVATVDTWPPDRRVLLLEMLRARIDLPRK